MSRTTFGRRLASATLAASALVGAAAAAAPAHANASCNIGGAAIIVRGVGSPYASSCMRVYSQIVSGNRVTLTTAIHDTRTDGKLAVGFARFLTANGWGRWNLVGQTGNGAGFTAARAYAYTLGSPVYDVEYAACASTVAFPDGYSAMSVPGTSDCGYR